MCPRYAQAEFAHHLRPVGEARARRNSQAYGAFIHAVLAGVQRAGLRAGLVDLAAIDALEPASDQLDDAALA
jgi:hypothetical protein